MKAKTIAEVGVVAALYAALVAIFAPISFAALQFRVAEILKPIVIKRKHAIWGIGLGNLLGNLAGGSYAGILELTLMPLTCLVWGYICWYVGNKMNAYLGSLLFAIGTSLSVASMLYVAFDIPFLATFLYVSISETVLLLLGTPLMAKISDILEKKNF